MFAAQSGAKKVYAVDASAVAFKAERNIKANGWAEIITFVLLSTIFGAIEANNHMQCGQG